MLAVIGSVSFAQAGPPAGTPGSPSTPTNENEETKQKEKDKKGGSEKDKEKQAKKDDKEAAEDLARTLQESEVGPVSRVMGKRIVASAVKPYIHGTLVVDWRWGDGTLQLPNTLELRESHLYLGAHILDFAQPEVFFQLEKRNPTSPPLELRYAQVDFRLHGELVVLRGGLFLIPFGVYNTDLFLRYEAKFPERPEIHRHVIAGSWSEVGVQAWGRWEWRPGRALHYHAYVTNGQVGALTSSRASYDPVFRSLTGAKSIGARVAVQPLNGLSVGLSGYRGALNGVDGALVLGALDGIFRYGPLSIDGELIYGQRLDPGPIPEGGFYVAAGYKLTDAVEPVVGLGGTSTSPAPDTNELDLDVGVNFYPFADRFPSVVLKAAYKLDVEQDGETGNAVTVAFVAGF